MPSLSIQYEVVCKVIYLSVHVLFRLLRAETIPYCFVVFSAYIIQVLQVNEFFFFLSFLYETLIRVWSVLTEAEVKVQAPLFHHPPPSQPRPAADAPSSVEHTFRRGTASFPGEGDGTPLQYSCPENPKNGGAW